VDWSLAVYGSYRVIFMYKAVTRGIEISVETTFLEDQSSPSEAHYVWAYHIRIVNNGNDTVQLRSRHWHITDSRGVVQTVDGEGVVGVEPTLPPGEAFEYTSGTPLVTPSGLMHGTYRMETASGDRFDAAIPAFSLDSPHEAAMLN
jgi:ApaG protein